VEEASRINRDFAAYLAILAEWALNETDAPDEQEA
jgi:hypothetical protein